MEAHPALGSHTLGDDFLQSRESAATDEEDVTRIELDELLVGMLAPALRRHVGNRAFDDLEQGLLHPFAGHIAGDRRVVTALARDLVDLVDVDDADSAPVWYPTRPPGAVERGCSPRLRPRSRLRSARWRRQW